jgi:amino acid adenylation domain-containing protein
MQNTEIIGFALSPQQKRLFFLDTELSVLPYVTRVKLVIEGIVDPAKLERALAEVVARHEILRTRFIHHSALKTLLQVIVPEAPVSLKLLEAGSLTENEASGKEIPALDLSTGRVFGCALAQITPEKWLLFLTMASVCGDALSFRKIVDDLAAAYRRSDSELAARQEDILQYADVSEHFNSVLESEFGSLGQQYWKPRNSTPGPEVPSSFELGTSLEGFYPKVVRTDIPVKIFETISRTFAVEQEAEETFLLACWHWLLQLTSRNDEFAVGYASSGRETAELADSVGPFERYLPLRLRSSADIGFCEFLKDVREAVQEARRWQGAFQWSDAKRFLPVCFSFYDASSTAESGPIRISCSSLSACSERFDLKLSCVKLRSSLQLELWYDPVAYPQAEAAQLLSQFMTLLKGVICSPEVSLSTVDAVNERERKQLLGLACSSIPEIRTEGCVAGVEEQAGINSEMIAVQYKHQQLTYAELNQRANQLAHFLHGLGIRPEVTVGICLERSLEMVVGLVGTLKAGAAYVPLDPNHPSERLIYMLKDAQAQVLLTHQPLQHRFGDLGIPVVCLDSDWPVIATHSAANPANDTNDENLAYVIYTSGSTGKPKGVGIAVRGLSNYVNWASNAYGCEPGFTAPLFSSIGFDLTVTSIWPLLVSGGRLVVMPEDDFVGRITAGVSHEPFGLVKLTPAHLNMLKDVLPEQQELSAHRFVIGGEALRWEDLTYWRQNAPKMKFVNEYGPTETVVGSCAYEVHDQGEEQGRVPIGRAIADTFLYVVDQWGRLAPLGAAGELYIGGAGVARGYLKQAALTAEKFVPDNFSSVPGGRLYRTQDLVRWNADGHLEYLERIDNQVKIRGYRIEPGEIEGVLARHASVRNAAVLMQPDLLGNKCLVAYVVLAQQTAKTDWEQLKDYLSSKLPEYMIPAAYVQMEELPLTLNGKLDQNALPKPEWLRENQKTCYVAPRTLAEEIMAGIWADVLKLEHVGVEDNFFELGGHSLLATQVISRVRSALDVELPLGALFKWPTIASLARQVEQQNSNDESNVDDLLAEVESLSEEEAEALLGAMQEPAQILKNDSVVLPGKSAAARKA